MSTIFVQILTPPLGIADVFYVRPPSKNEKYMAVTFMTSKLPVFKFGFSGIWTQASRVSHLS